MSFRIVRAFPKASKIGFDSINCCSMEECWPEAAAKNCNINLVETVLPEPDSPLTTTHFLVFLTKSSMRISKFSKKYMKPKKKQENEKLKKIIKKNEKIVKIKEIKKHKN